MEVGKGGKDGSQCALGSNATDVTPGNRTFHHAILSVRTDDGGGSSRA